MKARRTAATVSALLAVTALLTAGGTASAESRATGRATTRTESPLPSDALGDGETLAPGRHFDVGDTSLRMRENGDLALVTTVDGTEQQRWHTDTAGRGERAVMRPDGELVVTDRDQRIVWQSGTANCMHMAYKRLAVVPGGSMMIYETRPDADHPDSEAPYRIAAWSTLFGYAPQCATR
ncbi:hypothetical protein [Streptomyces orinoci]|uniref:Bulb-type lectin domain-containing protein n=1 Tax=Streptomyces orinoci TaxID=67339 RepID=A0ABV3JQI0_STRON|nr:hypothetical protein [Streptomyces orinoci]